MGEGGPAVGWRWLEDGSEHAGPRGSGRSKEPQSGGALLEMAQPEVRTGRPGGEAGFEPGWQRAPARLTCLVFCSLPRCWMAS